MPASKGGHLRTSRKGQSLTGYLNLNKSADALESAIATLRAACWRGLCLLLINFHFVLPPIQQFNLISQWKMNPIAHNDRSSSHTF